MMFLIHLVLLTPGKSFIPVWLTTTMLVVSETMGCASSDSSSNKYLDFDLYGSKNLNNNELMGNSLLRKHSLANANILNKNLQITNTIALVK